MSQGELVDEGTVTGDDRPLIVYGDGPGGPLIAPADVAALASLDEFTVLLGWLTEDRSWLAADVGLTGQTTMATFGMAAAVRDGRFELLPVRLSAMPRLLATTHRPAVAVVSGIPRGDGYAYKASVGFAPSAVAAARVVVVEVDRTAPDLGGPIIATVDHVVERPTDSEPPQGSARPVDDIDRRIGGAVASLVPPEATIQTGPGAVAEAFLEALDTPVGIWSGVITEPLAAIADRGLLVGEATTPYVWGGEAIERLAASGRLRLLPVTETHDLTAVSNIDRLIACNAAVQLGLDGSVNIERVGGRTISGIGGHADFSTAASRSVGGLSIIALRAATKKGYSTIVPAVDVVSTPRCDVDVVVTEHGIADLRGAGDRTRAERIIAVAAPDHRATLEAALG